MAQPHETIFYELMWRAHATGRPFPLPWWVQQYLRHWVEPYDEGLFDSKEAAFASNASYRYWNMVGVKDHHQESLIGQAGEIEPVYDQYTLSFFLFEPATRKLHFPQMPAPGGLRPTLIQEWEDGYLPVVRTTYRPTDALEVEEKVMATTVGGEQRSVVVARFTVRTFPGTPGAVAPDLWLCLLVASVGPTGFERRDRARRVSPDRRLTFLRYDPLARRVEANTAWGPLFDTPPAHFGLYGNEANVSDPDFYLDHNPFQDLVLGGALNGRASATDLLAGLCLGAFAWPVALGPGSPPFTLDVKLPVDDYRGADDLALLQAADPAVLEEGNRAYWQAKLDRDGLQMHLPPALKRYADLFKICRANLLMLADEGQIHPGPTIYDSFWIRDSSIEGIACALAGDGNLSERQFGTHYPRAFHLEHTRVGPVSLFGFFGGEHEIDDREWDANGQALWAIGRFDRIRGAAAAFGARLFQPYVVEGARWLRDNRSPYGLLHSGWSAEHLGDKHQPHYWDDLWAVAGLWEAARLAERIGAPEAAELWDTYVDLRDATAASIAWVLDEQRRRGFWETFIPTGPGDVGRLDSTMIGTVAYFHPCRLYMGEKLGPAVDRAARLTMETIWAHFIDGGFRHDSAWNAYGPYLTLQLAHAFLYLGDLRRMEALVAWTVENAAFAETSRPGAPAQRWHVAYGAWNEQHCYPIAKDFGEVPGRPWYMGDIPHGWACAEFMMLLRDLLFFEADEDGTPHLYVAPGVLPDWLAHGQEIGLSGAPTTYGGTFGYRLSLDRQNRTVTIRLSHEPAFRGYYVFPCRFGAGVQSVMADGQPLPVTGRDVRLPPGTREAVVTFT